MLIYMKKTIVGICIFIMGLCFVACTEQQVKEPIGESLEHTKQVIEDNTDYEDVEDSTDSIGEGQTEQTKEELSELELQEIVYEKYYSVWEEDELVKACAERSKYYRKSAYYAEVVDFWENVLEVRDITNRVEPMFYTDLKGYTEADFKELPPNIIHLAKNEIYARRGYIFKNVDLYNYFMGCVWYNQTCKPEDFEVSVFNEFEEANLKILVELDK